jgi:uncharacterized protein (TIGR00251 family)
MPPLVRLPDGVRVTVHVVPRASRTETAGLHGDALKLKIAAPPVDGAANAEMIRFLALAAGVPAGKVRIVAGSTSRRKVVDIAGANPADLARALGL